MDLRHEDGIAMIMAMAATLLMGALGMALVLTTSSETIIASNFRDASEAVYAADAAWSDRSTTFPGRPTGMPC